MTVTVKLYFTLRRYGQPNGADTLVESAAPMTIGDILKKLKIPEDAKAIVLKNGRPAEKTDMAADGDVIVMFPPVDGG